MPERLLLLGSRSWRGEDVAQRLMAAYRLSHAQGDQKKAARDSAH